MKKLLSIVIFGFFCFSPVTIILSQTKSYGNYEVYSYETSRNSLSYLTLNANLPFPSNSHHFSQTGVLYSYQYYMGEIGSYVFSNNARLRFISEGNFNIGFAMGKNNGETTPANTFSINSKFYMAKLDVYSYDVATEFTFVLDDGYALTAKLGLNLFSVGLTVGLPDNGTLKKDLFGTVNLVPLAFNPQILFDFGRSVVGIGMVIHPKNIVEYRYLPKTIFSNQDSGFKFNSNTFEEYAIQIWFKY